MSDLTLESLPAMTVAALPHKGAYQQIGPVFQRLGTLLAAAGAFPRVEAMIGLYHDNPHTVDAADLRSHAGVIWTGGDVPEGLETVEIPAGRHVALRHLGSYAGLPDAWGAFTPDALAALNAVPKDAPAMEIYRNDPTTSAEDELITDLYLPAE